MESTARPRLGGDPANAIVVGVFLFLPLAVSPVLAEPFTSPKWYLLELAAVCWFVLERFRYGGHGWPSFLRQTRIIAVPFVAFTVLQSLLLGRGWAVPPLLARASFLLLALSSFWYFRRNHLRTTALETGVTIAAAAVITMAALQFTGLWPLSWLPGGDPCSATFGNVNMAAQFAGLAVLVLLSRPRGSGVARCAPAAGFMTEPLAAGGFACVYLAATRSVGLALGAALLFLASVRRLPSARLLRAAAGAVALVLVVLHASTGDPGPARAEVRAGKARSVEMRLAVWSDTLDLILDHPFGVGAGNFEHAFIPYALAGRSRPDERLVYRSPHNEYLRVLAEHGLLGAGVLATLLVLLVRELHRSPHIARWRSDSGVLIGSCGTFLAVEALFQFPFEMAVPALLASVLLGLAWACVEPAPGLTLPVTRQRSRPGRTGNVAAVLVALAVAYGLGRVVAADYLSVVRRDARSLERACAWDGSRVRACLDAAWLFARAGNHEVARRLIDGLLERSPYFFPAIKLRGEVAIAVGDLARACRDLEAYDAMFGGRSSVSALVRQKCGRQDPRPGRE
jgi:O-antigen ligase